MCAKHLTHSTPQVTAISFVALGTSLPDLFASKQAVLDSTDADAAVGNVTGSNSVNVFLGLGLPYLIAAIYYTTNGQRFCGAEPFQVLNTLRMHSIILPTLNCSTSGIAIFFCVGVQRMCCNMHRSFVLSTVGALCPRVP